MFSTPHPNLIQADTFSVEVLGRTGLRYSDSSGRTVRVDSELLTGSAGLVVYSGSITEWQNPPGSITSEDRAMILEQIRQAFRFKGYEIEII